jgi:hypothetical protein
LTFREGSDNHLLWSRASTLPPPLALAMADQQRSIDLLPLVAYL